MSSSRFPGKVMQPFLGRPIISHILQTVSSVPDVDRVVVLTSDQDSDQKLVDYLQEIGCLVFRGPLNDVLHRFRNAAEIYPSEWVLRLCADSPLLSPLVVASVVKRGLGGESCDLVTTRFNPPFPKGQNAELISSRALLELDLDAASEHDREHVTPWFYRHRDRYRIADAAAVQIDLPGTEFTVDTPQDLAKLERLLSSRS